MPAPIPATNPTVLPAIPERVYPMWLIEEVLIAGTGTPEDPLRGQVRFRQFRELEGGAIELAPPEAQAVVVEPDLYALAAEDPDFAAALVAFTAQAVKRATLQGLL
jgi:hypothetical protein